MERELFGPLLFDGAMGTYMAQKFGVNVRLCEYENIAHPERTLAIHREYIAAGAGAVKTNTFAANTAATGLGAEAVEQMIRRGCALALQAAEGTGAQVFASIGPIAGDDEETLRAEYHRNIGVFLSCGVRSFLFETFHDYRTLMELARYIKTLRPDAVVFTECTVAPDHYTESGLSAQDILDHLSTVPEIDACGFNCTCGPMHMTRLMCELDFHLKPAVMMPNAGYPTVVSGRAVFNSSADYFAERLVQLRGLGARYVGGCCGTTPAHIAAAARLLRRPVMVTERAIAPKPPRPTQQAAPTSPLLRPGVIAVELDSPLDADLSFFVRAAVQLKRAGADLITIADCPVGRARADSSLLAALLRREYGVEALPHLTCRDRNLNATKALLLALSAQGVRSILAVTGDPIPSSDRDEIKSVFQFNSVRFIGFVENLNQNVFADAPFTVAAALNVNAPNFGPELEKARRKQQVGAAAFLTQPVYGAQAFENLRAAREALPGARLLGGIMPVVSYKNACFINNELAGITIPEALMERYRGVTREQAESIALETSLELARQIEDVSDGFYLITPLRRVELMCQLVAGIRARQARRKEDSRPEEDDKHDYNR